MPGRALVVGAVVDEIRGVENDVRAIAAFLDHRGFAVTALDPRSGATRDAILTGYQRLIDEVREGSDEPAVVYYAGHGGIVVNARCEDRDTALPSMFQCIIPIDYEDGSESDFRGITSFELSALQRRLASKTRNVTVILDCCHSAQMSRGDDAVRPRTLAAPTPVAMRRHLDLLRARYPEAFVRAATGSSTAVRLVACGERESAWPIRDPHGEWYGAFTLALLDTLGAVDGAPATWEDIGVAVTERVQRSYPGQNPRVEGPRRRRLFSLEEVPRPGLAMPADVLGAPGDAAPTRLPVPDSDVTRRLAVARELLELDGEHGIATSELAVTWGVVERGRPLAMPAHGAVLTLDVAIYVRIRNTGARALYIHVLNIGVDANIALLTDAAVTGVELLPGQETWLGNSPDDRELVGLELSWPPELPRDEARLDTIAVIATGAPADLRLLATPTARARAPTPRVYAMTTITYLIDARTRPVTSHSRGAR